MTSFEKFGENFQSKILYHLITDHDFSLQILDILKPEFFSKDHYGTISQLIIQWNNKYNTIPTFENIKTLLMKLYKDDEILSDYVDTLINDLEKTTTLDKTHVIDETVEFCKQQAFRNAIFESVELVKLEKYDDIYATFKNAMMAGEKKNLGHSYFNDINSRVMEKRYPISTGFPLLDDQISGGLAGGELGLILAGTGVGKSMMLVHLAAEGLRQGKNVLFFTFELYEKIVGLRIDCKLAGIPLGNLMIDNSGALRNRIANECDKIKRTFPPNNVPDLRIKFYPTKSVGMSTLYSYLQSLENIGFKPDMICVDYIDLIKPTHRYGEKRFELGDITEELRGMAGMLDIPVWSASQTSKEGWDTSLVSLKTISESSAKAFVADLVISVGRSQRLIELERACYLIAKSRLGPVGRAFTGEFDTSLLNFTIDTEGYEEDEQNEDRRNNMNRAVGNVLENRNVPNNNLNEILRSLNTGETND